MKAEYLVPRTVALRAIRSSFEYAESWLGAMPPGTQIQEMTGYHDAYDMAEACGRLDYLTKLLKEHNK